MAENSRSHGDESLEPPVTQQFQYTVETLRAELGNSHMYYLEAIKMVVRIPVASASVFFAFMAAYGLLLRVAVGYSYNSSSMALGGLLEVLALAIPIAGVFSSIVFIVAQYAAFEAMEFSADSYLTPNRIRLGLPRRSHVVHQKRRRAVRITLQFLFYTGHILSLTIWMVILGYVAFH